MREQVDTDGVESTCTSNGRNSKNGEKERKTPGSQCTLKESRNKKEQKKDEAARVSTHFEVMLPKHQKKKEKEKRRKRREKRIKTRERAKQGIAL